MKYRTICTTFTLILLINVIALSPTTVSAESRYASANFYSARGDKWYAQEAYDKALADYDTALTIDNKDAVTFNKRGLVWIAKEDFGQALKDFNRATKLDPSFAAAWYNHGVAWARKGKWERAIADYDKALFLQPQFAEALLARGLAQFACGKEQSAEADFARCEKINQKLCGEISSQLTNLKTSLVTRH